jgi:NAD(P)-dependent dehydrogenase (short-subunit alcohol dehydrogenase family)
MALAGSAMAQQVLRVTTIPEEAATEQMRKFTPIASYLEKKLGMKVEFTPVSDYPAAVEVLVNAAGTNAPQRALEVLSDADYRSMMDTNLNGAYYCVQAFLPGMRNRGSGTIVNIISDAGKQASPKAGPAYVMSKFGLAGLTQAINAEERTRGVRAIGIFPGDINTPLLNRRPVVPDEAARARMMQPEDIAACVLLAVQLPSRAVIEELVIRPR